MILTYELYLFGFSDSTVSGTDMNNLLILRLNPRDSKNYTCLPNAGTVENSTNVKPYTHHVIGIYKHEKTKK